MISVCLRAMGRVRYGMRSDSIPDCLHDSLMTHCDPMRSCETPYRIGRRRDVKNLLA